MILNVLSVTPEILGVFPQHTLAFKLALPVGLLLTAFGLRKGYQANNLWGWATRLLHKIPNKLTGKFNSFGKIGE